MYQDEETTQVPVELLDCQPAPGWALIRPDEKTDMTKGGIILPSGKTNMTGIRTGRVVAVGEPRQLEFGGTESVRCEPGNTVLFGDQRALMVHYEGTPHLLLKHTDVIARVKCAEKKYEEPAPGARLRLATEPVFNGLDVPPDLPRPFRN